jgi:hypothetical protein
LPTRYRRVDSWSSSTSAGQRARKRLLVCGLGGGKAGLIYAVVHIHIDLFVDAVDLRPKSFGIQTFGLVAECAELRLKVDGDIPELVRDQPVGLPVP